VSKEVGMLPRGMTLDEWIELRREVRQHGWDMSVLEMFLTIFDLRNGRNATVEEVQDFFYRSNKEEKQAAE
jgi:hypothetical protein